VVVFGNITSVPVDEMSVYVSGNVHFGLELKDGLFTDENNVL